MIMLDLMQIAPPVSSSDVEWLSLRLRLWPHAAEAEHLHEMGDALARGHCVRLALTSRGSAVGSGVDAARSCVNAIAVAEPSSP